MPRIDEAETLNPGLLRHQITWQRKSVSGQNSFGEDIVTWIDIVTVRAQVKPITGREFQKEEQRWADANYKIVQHFYSGMDHAGRGSWFVDGIVRYLDVLDIQDRGGIGRVQDIIARESAA